MSDESGAGHPTDAELAAWMADRNPAPEGAALLAHLHSCAPCRRRWAGVAAGVITAPKGAPAPPLGFNTYDFALLRAFARVELPAPRVWTLDDRKVHWAYTSAHLHLAYYWRDQGDLDEAHECAYYAVLHSLQLPDTGNPQALADLRCQTWCELGNLRRALNDLAGAEEALCEAMDFYEAGSRYPPMLARWLDVAGSLFRDQGRFDEALDALEEAAEIHLEHGRPHLAGRSKVNVGSVYLAMGKPRNAVAVLDGSFSLIDPTDAELAVGALHSTLFAFAEARDFEAAAKCLWPLRRLYELAATPKLKSQLLGLEARVAAGQGYFGRAERFYRNVIAAYQEAGQFYDAAIETLELAALLAQRGRPAAEILDLLDGAVWEFVERQIYRELMVCFKLLRETVEEGRNIAGALQRFVEEVRDHSTRPGVKR